MHHGIPRILSRPLGIEWAGWRTDTRCLQQSGWELAVDFDVCRYSYRLMMRHRMMHLYAITDVQTIRGIGEYHEDLSSFPIFNVVGCAPRIEVLRMQLQVDFSKFRQIDAQPQMCTREIQRPEDFNIFAVPMTRTQEIVVSGANMSVIEHLEAIKRLQEPEQQKIRDRILREGAGPEGTVPGTGPRVEMLAQIVRIAA